MNLLTTMLAQGTFLNRPLPTIYNAGWYYLATDVAGGTLYQSTGTSWTQIASGVSQGIPAGGSTNQVLGKTSSADYAVSWQTVAAGLTVEDLATVVSAATVLKFKSGATVTNAGAGEADVVIAEHVHVYGERMTGDGTTTVFYLAQEAEQYTAEAFVAGALTDVTQSADGAKITFASAPASAAAIRVNYLAVLGA